NVLEEDGAIEGGGLDAYSVHRAGEDYFGSASADGLPRSPVERSIGFFAGPSLVLQHSDYRTHSSSNYFNEAAIGDSILYTIRSNSAVSGKQSRTSVLAGPKAEFHRPIGAHWQIDAESQLLFPLRSEESGSEVASALSVSWTRSDRWLAMLKASQSRYVHKGDTQSGLPGSGWDVVVGGSVEYFLEDRVGLLLSLAEQQTQRNPSP